MKHCRAMRSVTFGVQTRTRVQKGMIDFGDSPELPSNLRPVCCSCTISWMMLGGWCTELYVQSCTFRSYGGRVPVTRPSVDHNCFGCQRLECFLCHCPSVRKGSINSVFIGHGYLQHAVVDCKAKYGLLYHTYLILEMVKLKATIGFVYGDDLNIAPKADAEVGSKESAAVVERNMTDIRSDHDRHEQARLVPESD